MSICDENLHDRLYRLPDFKRIHQDKDAVQLWVLACGLVCNDGADVDLNDQKFRSLNKYDANRMLTTPTSLTF